MQPDGNARINKIVQFVEGNYQRKISLEDIGEEVGMSATSALPFFQKVHPPEPVELPQRLPHRARRTDDRRDRRPDRRDRYALRVLQHLEFQPRLPRTHRHSPPGDYRRKFGSTVISPDAKQVEEIGRKLDEMRCGQDSAGGKSGGQRSRPRADKPLFRHG